MDVRCFSGPRPDSAAASMDPGLLLAKPPYPAGRFRVGSVQSRSRPVATVCGEALSLSCEGTRTFKNKNK
jgi:hypothetical protein